MAPESIDLCRWYPLEIRVLWQPNEVLILAKRLATNPIGQSMRLHTQMSRSRMKNSGRTMAGQGQSLPKMLCVDSPLHRNESLHNAFHYSSFSGTITVILYRLLAAKFPMFTKHLLRMDSFLLPMLFLLFSCSFCGPNKASLQSSTFVCASYRNMGERNFVGAEQKSVWFSQNYIFTQPFRPPLGRPPPHPSPSPASIIDRSSFERPGIKRTRFLLGNSCAEGSMSRTVYRVMSRRTTCKWKISMNNEFWLC